MSFLQAPCPVDILYHWESAVICCFHPCVASLVVEGGVTAIPYSDAVSQDAFCTIQAEVGEDVMVHTSQYRDYRDSGDVYTPLGAAVFRVAGEEVELPILTTCGVLVRKSTIQLHIGKFNPRSLCFMVSLVGTMMLNVNKQHSHIGVLFLCMCESGVHHYGRSIVQ